MIFKTLKLINLILNGLGVKRIRLTPQADAQLGDAVKALLVKLALLLVITIQPGICAADKETDSGPKFIRSEAVYSIPNVELIRHDNILTSFPQELDDGRPVILNFIFTSCSAICPMMSAVLSSVQTKLGDDIQKIHMVSISIDPEYDNAQHLQEYAEKFKAKPQWQFYSGALENVHAIQKAFGVFRGDKMKHSFAIFLRSAPGKPWVKLDGFLKSDDIIAEYRSLK
jgi:protein SCO1/2